MKRCPTCNRTFTDRNLSFCIDDGTPLVPAVEAADESTVVSPSSGDRGSNPARVSTPRDWQAPDYQPPGSYVSAVAASKRRVWPWVVGILALLLIGIAGLAFAAAIIIPNIMRASSNTSRSNVNANSERSENYDSNSNSNTRGPDANIASLNDNAISSAHDESAPPPPGDEGQVLTDLTNLEHEWTVANINADKRKLGQILADDYIGTSSDGKPQGKAEYLRTIERDTSIQKWDFEDLQVKLVGDRATLTGTIRLEIRNQPVEYEFTDKFVWRDGRWQAVGSEVTPMK